MSDPAPDSEGTSGILGFFEELKRRRVVRTVLYYGGISVAVVEGADTFAGPLGLPEGAVRALAILALSGFPLVVVLSWLYDLSHGEVDSESFLGRWGRAVIILGVASGSASLAYGLWTGSSVLPEDEEAGPPLTRIAVLAFDAPGGSDELQTLAAHLHGRLLDGLSAAIRAPGAPDPESHTVISRAGVLPFSGGEVTVDSIRRALDVGTIVEGSVEETADSVRIRLRLIDAASANQLDSRVTEAPRDDPVTLADRLSEDAVDMLREELGNAVNQRARLLGTRSTEAFRHVIWAEEAERRAAEALSRRDLEGAGRALGQADSLLAEASRLDPRWTEPLVLRGFLSDEHAQLATAAGEPLETIYRRGLALAEEALSIDSEDKRARHLRGAMHLLLAGLDDDPVQMRRRHDLAEGDLRVAIAENPRPASPLRRLSELMASQGRFQEALEFGSRAYVEDRYMDDTVATLLRLFQYSLRLDRDAEAARHCAEGRRRFQQPVFHDCRLMLMAWTDVAPPDPDSAWSAVDTILSTYPASLRPILEPRLEGMVAAVLARAGLDDSARVVLARAREADDGTVGMARTAAGTLALLGDIEGALAALRNATPTANDLDALTSTPELRSLRGDPRFEAFVDSLRERAGR